MMLAVSIFKSKLFPRLAAKQLSRVKQSIQNHDSSNEGSTCVPTNVSSNGNEVSVPLPSSGPPSQLRLSKKRKAHSDPVTKPPVGTRKKPAFRRSQFQSPLQNNGVLKVVRGPSTTI